MSTKSTTPVKALGWLLLGGLGCSGPDKPSQPDEGVETIGKTTMALTDASYAPDPNPDLLNPERGVFGSDVHSLKLNHLYLGSVCNTSLTWLGRTHASTSQILKDWATAAISRRDAGHKVIFRPRYDSSGSGAGLPNGCNKVEGNSYALMQNHIQAIAAMLGDPEIKPIVAFIEMGYLGSWGEWNTAGTTCGDSLAACRIHAPVLLAESAVNDRIHLAKYVIDTYRSAGVTRPVGLRRPEFYRDLASLGVASTKMGFYNDCFMRTDSDGGTFVQLEAGYPGYGEIYPNATPVLATAQDFKAYMQGLAPNGSQGGESCGDDQNETWYTQPTIVDDRLDADGFHYLNGSWAAGFRQHMITHNQWDIIRRRLGYRFEVSQVTYPSSAASGVSISVSVSIYNSGFAKIPYDRTAYLALHGPVNYVVGASNPKSDTYTLIAPTSQSNQNARSWTDNTTTVFSQTFPAPPIAGNYSLHLYVPDTDCVNNSTCNNTVKSNYAVKLATLRGGANVFSSSTGTNNLGLTLTVSTAPTHSLNVRTYNQATNAEISGLWTVVNDASGAQHTGFSPITFNLPAGTTNVSVADYQQYVFNHWENGTTVRPRALSLTGSLNVGGYYAVGTGCIAPNSGNKVSNAGFDSSNVSAFQPFDSQIQVGHSTLDASGCGSSGSLLLTNNAPNGLNSGAYQCVTTIVPGAAYNVGGRMRVPSGGAQGQAFLHFLFTNGANCTGTFVGEQVLLSGPSSFDTWQSVRRDNLVTPSNAVSMQVYGAVIKNFPSSLPYRAHFDMLYVTPVPGEF